MGGITVRDKDMIQLIFTAKLFPEQNSQQHVMAEVKGKPVLRDSNYK